jgi:DNA-binding transcriptional LysR family regulator
MQIRKLEDAVGAPLFERTRGAVAPTARGELLLGHARRLIEMHDRALDEVRGRLVEGSVRIGVMDDYATHVLPELFARFGGRHPGVTLEVTTGFTSALVQELGSAYDLVLATQGTGVRAGRVLRTERTCWAYSATRPLPDLAVVPLAVLPPGNLFRNWATDALDRAGMPWRVVYGSTSIAAIESAAAAGIAVTVVKAGTARRDLRLLGPEDRLPALPASAIALHRAPGHLPPAVEQLAGFLEDELSRPPR